MSSIISMYPAAAAAFPLISSRPFGGAGAAVNYRSRRVSGGGALFPSSMSMSRRYLAMASSLQIQIQSESAGGDRPKQKRNRSIPWPWLILSSPTKPEYRHFVDVLSQTIAHTSHLPSIAGHQYIGSSQGFLITLDEVTTDIFATDPLTGSRLPLPSTSTLPPVNHSRFTIFREENPNYDWQFDCLYFGRAILSPSLDSIFLIPRGTPAFAPIGGASWSLLPELEMEMPQDCIFHKGLLFAIDFSGALIVHDIRNDPFAPPFIPTTSPAPFEHCGDTNYRRFLVESPDGEDLFLVFRGAPSDSDEDLHSENVGKYFKVFRLESDGSYMWKRIESIGDLAFFVGLNESLAVHASSLLPIVKPDCIYFTDLPYFKGEFDHPAEMDRHVGEFSLKDGSFRLYKLDDGLKKLNYPPPIWFMPYSSC